jgi:hypothetical protein
LPVKINESSILFNSLPSNPYPPKISIPISIMN